MTVIAPLAATARKLLPSCRKSQVGSVRFPGSWTTARTTQPSRRVGGTISTNKLFARFFNRSVSGAPPCVTSKTASTPWVCTASHRNHVDSSPSASPLLPSWARTTRVQPAAVFLKRAWRFLTTPRSARSVPAGSGLGLGATRRAARRASYFRVAASAAAAAGSAAGGPAAGSSSAGRPTGAGAAARARAPARIRACSALRAAVCARSRAISAFFSARARSSDAWPRSPAPRICAVAAS